MFDRRRLLTAAAALPLAACATRYSAGSTTTLKVMTLNIWHDAGDWPTRLKLIADVLRASDADVIALQEILEDKAKNLPNQADTIAALLDGYSVNFTAVDPEGSPKRYGNAILSRLPVIETATKKLEPLNDFRTAIRARVDVGGRVVDVVNTHLAHQPDAGPMRARQITDLLAWLPTNGTPLVVMGDFNAPLEDSGLAGLAARGLQTALPPGAAQTTLVTSRGHSARVIDHIFVERDRFTVNDARTIADQPVGGEYPSDHYGVAATLALR
ncbi:endonuclease/exonuclease/phosphatase family protein [Sphingomonas sp. AX6]|uniref:endonuclease/exonuclease/phosphatase family protein n=1 Tax=Sphingomonas sp. AX6 TaxID=2653171 RepID=UPI0012F31EA1|nr:endonuclease/exonuclease/phosphatase family protein [Sphingomonas sp. AX6]VXC54138.1 conserved exported hypothetical protein [Sphingomonas sp. AX6]